MKYCSQCGQPVVLKVPPEDRIARFVCEACGTIHYQNPRMVVGCVPQWEGRILLCRRAIEPRHGYWTLPAGFMENQETLEAAAQREAREEALAEVQIEGLLAVVNVPQANQVHLFFRGLLVEGRYGVGHESLEARLYGEQEIPWGELAFPSVEFALRRYLADREGGREGAHVTTLQRLRRTSA
jgi:ADP-ribose pyrophosphatase YjhB (NUDIX family)